MIETRSKAQEFIDLMVERNEINTKAGFEFFVGEIYHTLMIMPDREFNTIVGMIKNNVGRPHPKDKEYSNSIDVSHVSDLLWYCDCAKHVDHWSSVWWVLKKLRTR